MIASGNKGRIPGSEVHDGCDRESCNEAASWRQSLKARVQRSRRDAVRRLARCRLRQRVTARWRLARRGFVVTVPQGRGVCLHAHGHGFEGRLPHVPAEHLRRADGAPEEKCPAHVGSLRGCGRCTGGRVVSRSEVHRRCDAAAREHRRRGCSRNINQINWTQKSAEGEQTAWC